MALSTPLINVQDGAANAAVAVAANASAFVTPGNAITFSLQSTTGVFQCQFVIRAPGSKLDGMTSPVLTGNGPFSWTVQLSTTEGLAFTLFTEVSDGNNPTFNMNSIVPSPQNTFGYTHKARGVCSTNQSLTAFVGVTGGTAQDGITYVQGDYVLLANQTTASQNGVYVVGVVAAGTAPLTRSQDLPSGLILTKTNVGQVCELGPEGTLFGSTLWKITTTGPVTIGTTSHVWYPRQVTQSILLTSGTKTISNVPVLSATASGVTYTRTTPTSTSSTIMYGPVGAITPGTVGTASIVFDAQVAAGTINSSDGSTLAVTVTNF
jgi:hypothetical protein